MVGDLAGFAAAIVNRGCGFVQVPTTLLAQVDSSVGGKTAINVAAGKNLVGAFHQPSLVLIDPSLLDTLDPRQVRAGYAEIVKYALIEDARAVRLARGRMARRSSPAIPPRATQAIAAAVAGKARIVEEDERETSGRRALLNLGHTFGHALEAETGYSDSPAPRRGGRARAACSPSLSRPSAGSAPLRTPSAYARISTAVGLPTTLAELGLAGAGRAARRAHAARQEARRRPDRFHSGARHRRGVRRQVGRARRCRRFPRPRATDDALRRGHRRPDRPFQVAADPQILARSAGHRRRLLARRRVAGAELAGFLADRRGDPDWRGCNVTIPHKQAIIPLLDRLDRESRSDRRSQLRCSARAAALAGYNTDVDGIAAALDSTETDRAQARL